MGALTVKRHKESNDDPVSFRGDDLMVYVITGTIDSVFYSSVDIKDVPPFISRTANKPWLKRPQYGGV